MGRLSRSELPAVGVALALWVAKPKNVDGHTACRYTCMRSQSDFADLLLTVAAQRTRAVKADIICMSKPSVGAIARSVFHLPLANMA